MKNKNIKIKNLQNIVFRNDTKKIHLFNNKLSINQSQIKKIINNSENKKILFNKNINQNIIIKVKEINYKNIQSIYCELLAYKKLKSITNQNIAKKIKSVLCNTDEEEYKFLQKDKLNLCKKGYSNIPIIIFVLEYKDGKSFYDELQINNSKNLFIDFIKQLFFIFYSLSEIGVKYCDLNLNNFLVKKQATILNYNIEGFLVPINVNYFISLIDMDKVLFGAEMKNQSQKFIIDDILNKDNFFYKILFSLKQKFSTVINFSELEAKIFLDNVFSVNQFLEIINNLIFYL